MTTKEKQEYKAWLKYHAWLRNNNKPQHKSPPPNKQIKIIVQSS